MPRSPGPALLLSTLLVAGCGSGSGHPSPATAAGGTGDSTAKAAYGHRAGAILRPAGSRLAKLRVEMARAGTPEQGRREAAYVRRLASTTGARLASVPPPPAIAAQHRALLAELREVAGQASGLELLATKASFSRFLARAALFENAPVFRQLGVTIAGIQSRGVDLGLGPARS